MKWALDLWYELWDRAGGQGLDVWYGPRADGVEDHAVPPPDKGETGGCEPEGA